MVCHLQILALLQMAVFSSVNGAIAYQIEVEKTK
jgi:hypothetical protein